MYSTCLFCHSDLGKNEAIEHFPLGRRLAFDAAKGRLWVVCRRCERWNLTPLEERWEAIEECERSFRGTKLRTSTDQIGLARINEGLELVRIGKPLRPEFASWRYGDQFGRRRRKTIIQTGAVVAGLVVIPALGAIAGISTVVVGRSLFDVGRVGRLLYHRTHVVARVRDNDGNLLYVRTFDARETVMLPPSSDRVWGLRITHRTPLDSAGQWWRYGSKGIQTDIHGEDALRVAGQLLPGLNGAGASKKEIESAVALATQDVDASLAFERCARLAKRSWISYGKGAMLTLLPNEMRLALEMTSHGESERRAMEGELRLLEDAWREAEEVAAISDDMFLPTEVSESLAKLKSRPS